MKNIRKGMLKKISATMTAFALILTLFTGVVSAAITQDSKGTITVNDLDAGTVVDVYKIINVNVENGAPKEPVFTWESGIQSWITTNFQTYINTTNNEVTAAFLNNQNADEVKSFYEKMAAAIKDGTISSLTTESKTEVADKKVEFTNMAMGGYLLTAKGGVKVYSPTIATIVPEFVNSDWNLKNATVSMKGELPTITKTVTNPDSSVAIGDTVSYNLATAVPNYPVDATAVQFTIADTLSAGLTIDVASIKVYKDNSVIDASNYTIDTISGTFTFKISFTDNFVKSNIGASIKVTYDAVVNENALTIDALKNTASIGYNNDPYDGSSYKENTTEVKVYTYGIIINKVDATTNASLTGAEFSLSKDGAALKFTKNASGIYVLDTNGSETLQVDTNGEFIVQGIDEGTYELKETKAPAGGYVLPNGKVTITIAEVVAPIDGNLQAGDVTVASDGSVQIDSNTTLSTNKVEITVKNSKSGSLDLPITGGAGTTLFTAGGLVLMSGAYLLYARSRKAKHNQ